MRVETILFYVISIIAFIIWWYGWQKADRAYWRGFRMGQNTPLPPEHYNARCMVVHDVEEFYPDDETEEL